MRKKILFVINSLAGGGAERVFSTILNASQDRLDRHDISVALLDEDREAYTVPDSFPLHRLDCGHSLLRSVRRLSALVGRNRPDLVLSFLTRANVAGVLAARRHGSSAVISERVDTTAHLSGGGSAWLGRQMVRRIYPLATRILAVSDGVAGTLERDFAIRRDKIDVIFNPVDTPLIAQLAAEPAGIDIGPADIVVMGRLVPNKNHALAIRAFAASTAKGRLVLMGEGPERDSLRALGDACGLGDRLAMPGFAANPYAVVSRAGFLLSASNAEGFPNALVEALACGVPVVATDCPSGPAQVLDTRLSGAAGTFSSGAGGLLVPVDDRDAMVAAIDEMQHPSVRDDLAAKGRERVKDFSVERAVSRYWSAIERAMEATDSRRTHHGR